MEWHPFAEKFPLLEGDEWKVFRESIRKTRGNELPVTYRMVNGKKQGLDGRNRLRACEELGIECRMEKVFIDDADVKEFIIRRNVHRRHLTREIRQQIVGDLRADGQSTRQIADTLGVSEGTVRNDLNSGAQNCAPERVTGKDGKSYPSSRIPSDEAEIEQLGDGVPAHLKPILKSAGSFEHAARSTESTAQAIRAAEESPAYKALEAHELKLGKRMLTKRVLSNDLHTAARHLTLIKPSAVCPDCKGVEPSPDAEWCSKCGGKGYLIGDDLQE